MRSKRYPITIVLFWIIVVAISFLVENVALLSTDPREGMGLKMFVVVSSITILFVALYFYYEVRYNKTKVNWILLGGILLFFVVGVSTILAQPNHRVITDSKNGIEVMVDFTNRQKVIFIIQLFLTLLMMYIFLCPYKNRAYSLKIQTWVYWLYIGISFITVIVSFFTDFNTYKSFFVSGGESGISGVGSFYVNSNFYGMAMMMSVMSLLVVQINRHRFYNTILMVFFIIAGIFSGCATTVMASIFIFLAYYIFDLIYAFKKNANKTLVRLIVAILVVVIAFVTTMILYKKEVTFIKTSVDYCIKQYIDGGIKGFSSFSGRKGVWDAAKTVIFDTPASIFFGGGFKTGSWLMHSYFNAASGGHLDKYQILTSHSALFELWVRFGFLGVSLYVGLMLFYFVYIIYLFKKKEVRFAYIFLLCFIAIAIHGITESTFFFEGNTKGATITILFYVPVLSEVRRHQLEGRKELLNYHNADKVTLSFTLIAKLIITILSMFMVSCISLFAAKTIYQGDRVVILSITF
ncbi:MAG: hypothetical protein J5666_02075, partial [Bacilli bacterium]|nr:hypothetical protein [Bacilli bacterium]